MLRVAIVGNIASGKSTVEKFLKNKGFPVADSDEMCHQWLDKAPEIIERFSKYDILDDGKISREKLGNLVFRNHKLKKVLEDILYSYVRVDIARFQAKNINSKYTFVSVPLLFEAKFEDMFDKIIFVYCDDDIRLNRLIKRNNYTREYALLRMNAQQPQQEKIKKSDWVVYNNKTVADLEKEVAKLIE